MCVGFFACNLNTNSTGQENPRSQNQAITMYLPESQKPTHMSDFFTRRAHRTHPREAYWAFDRPAPSRGTSTQVFLSRNRLVVDKKRRYAMSFSKLTLLPKIRPGKTPTRKWADGRFRAPGLTYRRFLSTEPHFSRRRLTDGLRLLHAPSRKPSRCLKACRRASLSAWRGCQPGCDRRACASRLPSASRRVAPDRSTPPPHN